MKVKQLLGMLALDVNANEIGKITDIDFDPASGKIEKLTITLKKNILSNDQIEIDYIEIKSIGDYVLLNSEVNKKPEVETKDVEVE